MKAIGDLSRSLSRAALAVGALVALAQPGMSEAATGPSSVATEGELRAAWADPRVTRIELTSDIALHACRTGDPIRESARPIELEGNGHSIRQTCFEDRVLRQDGTGFVRLDDVWLKRGGSDGPGAAITTRGEIELRDSKVSQSLAEEPGGGVFSMRRATIIRSVLTGNLANDDGGAVYARRGGVKVIDSILNGNLVDGSGGAIGSTGDVKVIGSNVDGNTTDGDGGAIYTDEDGDVTIVDSSVDGSTADGPGGAIFTLDGDVTVVGSTVNGNRADDRGGAISGEADVFVMDSTIARNAAVAHVGGGVWSRGDIYMSGSTVSNNYAEGQGGGLFGAGDVNVAYSTVTSNVAPIAGSIGAGSTLRTFGSVIGPPSSTSTGEAQPTTESCRVTATRSFGYNVTSDVSCGLDGVGDQQNVTDPKLAALGLNGGFGETRMPALDSAAVNSVPVPQCRFTPFGSSQEGEQHLAGTGVDLLAPIEADQRGGARPFGTGCDSGSVEAGSTPTAPVEGAPSNLRFAPGPAATRASLDPPQPAKASVESDGPEATPARLETVDRSPSDRTRRALEWSQRRLHLMLDSVRRYDRWSDCLSEVPVAELGDDDGADGYSFDELDGSGPALRSAITTEKRSRADYLLLNLARERGCDSAPTVPGGTADPARASARLARSASGAGEGRELRRLLRTLEGRAEVVERAAKRFDEFESCLRWLPVTEYGDPERRFGYRYRDENGDPGYRAAVAVDRSAWDDPDYEVLVLKARRGGGVNCEGDPGEGVDRTAARSAATQQRDSAAGDLLKDAQDLQENVEDLREPIDEFETFDQCMFTLGMTEYGSRKGDSGYLFHDRTWGKRPALAIDIDGFDPPEYDFLAFPGEEPPQIECNEDASGEGTDE